MRYNAYGRRGPVSVSAAVKKYFQISDSFGGCLISKISFSDSPCIICVLYRQTGISYSLHSLKCLRLLSLLISIRGKPRLIIGNTVLLIMSMSIASKCSGGRFSSHLHWCKSRVIELFQIQSRQTALIGFSVSIKKLLNSASDSVLTLFSFDFMLIYSVQHWFRAKSTLCRQGHLGRKYI